MTAKPARLLIAIATAAGLLAASARGDTDLRAIKAIVTGEEPSRNESLAVRVLQQQLATMLGVKLETTRTAPTNAGAILVGRAAVTAAGLVDAKELDALHADGFIIRVRNGRVALSGRHDWGTVYAAYCWLTQLGYRYYAPELSIAPTLEITTISDSDTIKAPSFDLRRGVDWALGGTTQEMIGDPRIPGGDAGVKLWIDHTAGLFVPRPTYLKSHPEYYPLRHDGTRGVTRDSDGYVHLCLSNPDVLRITTDAALAWIEQQRERKYFFITQGDGHDWCQCESCLALDEAPGVYADRLLVWVNHIAAAVKSKYPDKILLALAYVGSDEPSLREKPADNVMVLYCPYWGVNLSMAHPLTHEINSEALAQFDGWKQVAGDQLGVYDYNLGYSPSWFAMADKLKWYHAQGVRGIFLLGAPQPFNRMFSYVMGRLLWDISLDSHALTREFVEAYYGQSAPHLMDYLELVQLQLEKGHARGLHDGNHMPAAFYDEPHGSLMLKHLDDAAAAVVGDEVLAARVAHERKLFFADRKTAYAVRDASEPDGEPAVTAAGVIISASAFRGGHFAPKYNWFCAPAKDGVVVYAPRSPRPSKATAAFKLDAAPTGPVQMIVEGQDSQNDLPPTAQIELTINGVTIHRGDCGFVKQGWSKRTLTIPAGVLRAGENILTFANVHEGTKRLDGWWCMISQVVIQFDEKR